MKIDYPSKLFADNAKAALNARQVVEVCIAGGCRVRMLAREMKYWATTRASMRADGGPARSPSFFFNLLNVQLVAFHWFALSADYEMQSAIHGNTIVLKYIPYRRTHHTVTEQSMRCE